MRVDGQLILTSRVLRNELSGQVGLADILCIVRREVITRQTERTGPQLRHEIHLTVRIEHGATLVAHASDGLVLEGNLGHIVGRYLLKRGVEAAQRRHAACSFDTAAGPALEGLTNSVLLR